MFNWVKYFLLTIILSSSLMGMTPQAALNNPSLAMKTPPYLKPGDTIGIVATARKHLDDDFLETKQLLESWGLHIKIGESIGLDYHQLAGNDKQRAAALQAFLDNPNIKAIWCARGGYGSVRLLKHLNWQKFKAAPKWLIGFSDVTVLHQQIQALGFESIHALMVVNVLRATNEAKTSLRKALFGESLSYMVNSHIFNKTGQAKGVLVGGNLSLIFALSGTPIDLNPDQDLILFIEDLDEYLYHIDRMMMQLDQKGLLAKLKGLVVGGMSTMKDNAVPWGKNAYEIIEEVMEPYDIPIIYDFPAGHIKDNRALILGRRVSLRVDKDYSQLTFLP